VKGKGKTEQILKLKTTQWEDTVVIKHETWKTYNSIKVNYEISKKNLVNVNHSLKEAEKKITQIKKQSALRPHDIALKQKVKEANRIALTIKQQKIDAQSQKQKMA